MLGSRRTLEPRWDKAVPHELQHTLTASAGANPMLPPAMVPEKQPNKCGSALEWVNTLPDDARHSIIKHSQQVDRDWQMIASGQKVLRGIVEVGVHPRSLAMTPPGSYHMIRPQVDVIQTPTCWTCQPKLDQEQWARVNHQALSLQLAAAGHPLPDPWAVVSVYPRIAAAAASAVGPAPPDNGGPASGQPPAPEAVHNTPPWESSTGTTATLPHVPGASRAMAVPPVPPELEAAAAARVAEEDASRQPPPKLPEGLVAGAAGTQLSAGAVPDPTQFATGARDLALPDHQQALHLPGGQQGATALPGVVPDAALGTTAVQQQGQYNQVPQYPVQQVQQQGPWGMTPPVYDPVTGQLVTPAGAGPFSHTLPPAPEASALQAQQQVQVQQQQAVQSAAGTEVGPAAVPSWAVPEQQQGQPLQQQQPGAPTTQPPAPAPQRRKWHPCACLPCCRPRVADDNSATTAAREMTAPAPAGGVNNPPGTQLLPPPPDPAGPGGIAASTAAGTAGPVQGAPSGTMHPPGEVQPQAGMSAGAPAPAGNTAVQQQGLEGHPGPQQGMQAPGMVGAPTGAPDGAGGAAGQPAAGASAQPPLQTQLQQQGMIAPQPGFAQSLPGQQPFSGQQQQMMMAPPPVAQPPEPQPAAVPVAQQGITKPVAARSLEDALLEAGVMTNGGTPGAAPVGTAQQAPTGFAHAQPQPQPLQGAQAAGSMPAQPHPQPQQQLQAPLVQPGLAPPLAQQQQPLHAGQGPPGVLLAPQPGFAPPLPGQQQPQQLPSTVQAGPREVQLGSPVAAFGSPMAPANVAQAPSMAPVPMAPVPPGVLQPPPLLGQQPPAASAAPAQTVGQMPTPVPAPMAPAPAAVSSAPGGMMPQQAGAPVPAPQGGQQSQPGAGQALPTQMQPGQAPPPQQPGFQPPPQPGGMMAGPGTQPQGAAPLSMQPVGMMAVSQAQPPGAAPTPSPQPQPLPQPRKLAPIGGAGGIGMDGSGSPAGLPGSSGGGGGDGGGGNAVSTFASPPAGQPPAPSTAPGSVMSPTGLSPSQGGAFAAGATGAAAAPPAASGGGGAKAGAGNGGLMVTEL